MNFHRPQLFFPLPEGPVNQFTKYVHCPATGHMYCLTNGCLYPTSSVTHPLCNVQHSEQKTNAVIKNPPTLQPEEHVKQETERVTSPKSENKTKATHINTLDKLAERGDPPKFLTQLQINHEPQKSNKKQSKKKKQKVKPTQSQQPSATPLTKPVPCDTKPADIGSKPSSISHSSQPDISISTKKTKKIKPAPTCKKQRKTKKKIKKKSGQKGQRMETPVNIQDQQTTKKRFRPRIVKSPSVWSYVRPFNRRPRSKTSRHHPKRESVWADKCKNCILASSVHDMIHSQFAKDTSQPMPEFQLRSLLLSRDRKLEPDKPWMKSMENEAIKMYKNIKQEPKHKVLDYDMVHHPEKPWLLGYSRWVIDRSTNDKWPLLVKCLYKYPDSRIRQACTHRSFCLRWDGVSYTLKRDHACYTQIQCLLAITDLLYAELLVHTRKETAVVPVNFDADFWEETEFKLETFFSKNVLPFLKKVRQKTQLDNSENNMN